MVADRAVQGRERTSSNGTAEAGDHPLGGYAETPGGEKFFQ